MRNQEAEFIHAARRGNRNPEAQTTIYPLSPLTNTGWDGNDTKTAGSYTIDTSALFSLPVGVIACVIYLQGTWASADATYRAQVLTPGASGSVGLIRAQSTMPQGAQFVVPCDTNGDFVISVENASMTNALLRIVSYTI